MSKTAALSINPSIPTKSDTAPSGSSTSVKSFTASSFLPPISPTSPPFSPYYPFSDSSSSSPSSRGDSNDDSDASGYDSDATLDLADPASPLKDSSPLRRMSCGYERDVLRSLSHSHGGGVVYACACSRNNGPRDGLLCRAHVGCQADEITDYNAGTGSLAKSYFVSLEYEEAGVNDFGPESHYFYDRDHGLHGATLKRSHTVNTSFHPLPFIETKCECDILITPGVLDYLSKDTISLWSRAGDLTGCAEAPF